MDAGLFFVALLGIAVVVRTIARKLELPYTVALVTMGLLVGALHPATAPRLTRESLYLVFLPGLVYEAALRIDRTAFLASKKTILLLALPGVFVAMVLTWGGVLLLAPFVGSPGVRSVDALLFGALISATDPIAVVAVFRALGAPARLVTLVESESLLNDATAIVLFEIVLEAATGARFTAGWAILELVRLAFLGALTGAVVALAVMVAARWAEDAVTRAALTTVAAYGSFLAAERLHASGVIATLVAGLMTAHANVAAAPGTEERRFVEACWEYASFALNSIVFLLVGFQAIQLGDLVRLWLPIVAAYLVVTASRAIVVAAVTRALRRSREAVPSTWRRVLVWSGLRGALSMVLALDLPESLPARQTLLTLTSGVVVLSILLQGLTMTPLLRRLGILAPRRAATC
jgi:CPA1 family monovalent cation:H+ antiporter